MLRLLNSTVFLYPVYWESSNNAHIDCISILVYFIERCIIVIDVVPSDAFCFLPYLLFLNCLAGFDALRARRVFRFFIFLFGPSARRVGMLQDGLFHIYDIYFVSQFATVLETHFLRFWFLFSYSSSFLLLGLTKKCLWIIYKFHFFVSFCQDGILYRK